MNFDSAQPAGLRFSFGVGESVLYLTPIARFAHFWSGRNLVVLTQPSCYLCICMHACMDEYVYAFMYLWTREKMFEWMCVCMYECMHVWMYACMHVRMYVWIQHTYIRRCHTPSQKKRKQKLESSIFNCARCSVCVAVCVALCIAVSAAVRVEVCVAVYVADCVAVCVAVCVAICFSEWLSLNHNHLPVSSTQSAHPIADSSLHFNTTLPCHGRCVFVITPRKQLCAMTHSYVWHDSLVCDTSISYLMCV